MNLKASRASYVNFYLKIYVPIIFTYGAPHWYEEKERCLCEELRKKCDKITGQSLLAHIIIANPIYS
jgi:hypothetical protein